MRHRDLGRLSVVVRLLLIGMWFVGGAVEGSELLSRGVGQALVVITEGWETVRAEARMVEKRDGKWVNVGGGMSAVVGRAGLGWGIGVHPVSRMGGMSGEPIKREGDKRGPAGVFRLTQVFGHQEAASVVKRMPFTVLTETIEGVDDPRSVHYNRVVDAAKVESRDWRSSEKMLAMGAVYRLGVVVEHNWVRPRPGGGSCIFLHAWRSRDSGTDGCTAFSGADIRRIVGWLDPDRHPVLVQMPRAVLERSDWGWAGVSF